jgi:hypothetical protein
LCRAMCNGLIDARESTIITVPYQRWLIPRDEAWLPFWRYW